MLEFNIVTHAYNLFVDDLITVDAYPPHIFVILVSDARFVKSTVTSAFRSVLVPSPRLFCVLYPIDRKLVEVVHVLGNPRDDSVGAVAALQALALEIIILNTCQHQ